jgi:PEP-CTERM motif
MDSGSHVGAVTQTIPGLTVGKYYDVSFYWAAAQQYGFSGATTDKFTVSLGGESETTPVLSIPSHGFSGWAFETLKFKVTSSSEVLSFLASGTPNGVPPFALLDGVSMAVAPEPATWALLGIGVLAGFARFRYSRKLTRKR